MLIKAKQTIPSDEELEARLIIARDRLFVQQQLIKDKKLPVMVVIDGFGTAGKGSVIGRVIKIIDPRFFGTVTNKRPSEEETRRPFLYRYFVNIPEQGKFKFYDGSWMQDVTRAKLRDDISPEKYRQRIDSVKRFERTLSDNGYLVMKFFLDISKKEQKERLDKLKSDKNTKWRVGEYDLYENEHFDKCSAVYEQYIYDTDMPHAPWYIIDAKNKKWSELQVLEILVSSIDTALKNSGTNARILQNVFPLRKAIKLSEVELKGKTIPDSEYREKLDALQKRLTELHNIIYRKKIPVIICYEGWDAAGKGGNIKRITTALDARGFEVQPIASPLPPEKARHFLWRFWTRLPKDGHITIFDRTWYGRVMVERIEGFCSENDWQRAYNEINEFEKELDDWGAVVIKFWVQIDKETQLARFTERQNTPEKQWKITDEDWRNREKWDAYESAIDEMLAKTNTEFAPWVILESNDKKYARVKALETIVKRIEDRLK